MIYKVLNLILANNVGAKSLMTNYFGLKGIDVVWLFRQQFTIERVFSDLKDQAYSVKVRPIFYHKDSSIRGHIFGCILDLLLIYVTQTKSKFTFSPT